jgi:bifunctional DNA-binding transcriptional regulator/antitoxin component of YhaV-PrlF toxin-antitoxin module
LTFISFVFNTGAPVGIDRGGILKVEKRTGEYFCGWLLDIKGKVVQTSSDMEQGARRAPDYKQMVTMVLNIGANGELTIPAGLQKELGVGPGGRLSAVRVGDLLVLAPFDEEIETFSQRLQSSMRLAGVTVEELQEQVLAERAAIIEERYSK